MKKVSIRTSEGKQPALLMDQEDLDLILKEHEEKIFNRLEGRISAIVDAKIRMYAADGLLEAGSLFLAKRADMAKQTKKILKNYRRIKENVDKVLLDRCRKEKRYRESFEWFDLLMRNKDPDGAMEAIAESNLYTAILVCKIDYAIDQYRKMAAKAGKKAWTRCGITFDFYISETKLSVAELSEVYGLQKSMIYSYMNDATEEIAALLFPEEVRSPENEPF